jgi:hypothetical protein
MTFEPADLLLFYGREPISRLISVATREKGPSMISQFRNRPLRRNCRGANAVASPDLGTDAAQSWMAPFLLMARPTDSCTATDIRSL